MGSIYPCHLRIMLETAAMKPEHGMITKLSSSRVVDVKKNISFIVTLTIILILTSFSWQSTFAQDETHLETIEVSIIPEVKSASMTVNLDITLADDTPLPKTLYFQIPANAHLQTIANRLDDGSLSDIEKVVTTDGTWQEIELTASSPNIQIEYDDPNLTQENGRQFFTFEWHSIYALNSLSVVVQQPSGVSNLATEPSLTISEDEATGTTFFCGEAGHISAGESWRLALSYALVSPSLEVVPATPINETTTGWAASPLSVIVWLLVAAVVILIFLGLYYWWFKRNIIIKHQRTIREVKAMNPEKGIVFCRECGMFSQAGDDYCRNCGTQLLKTGKATQTPQT